MTYFYFYINNFKNALFRLAFAMAPKKFLTKPYFLSRRLILQQARGQLLYNLPLFVSIGFHVLFHSPSGVLFTFPSRYYFTIGHLGVFSLTRWSSLIHTGFHVSHTTRDNFKLIGNFKLLDFHHLWYSIRLFHIITFY